VTPALRIAHVANFVSPTSGGLRSAMWSLARGYRAAGHQPILVVPGPDRLQAETSTGLVCTIPAPVVPGTGGYRVITDVAEVRRLLEHLQPDRLEVSDRTTLRDLGRWARQRGVPSSVWAHERLDGVLAQTLGRAVPPGRLGDAALRAAVDAHNRGTAARFDRVLCTTEYAAAEFARIGVTVARVPLGVDLDTFHPARRRRDAAEGNALQLVLCSRLSVEKRPELAIDTLAELRRRGVDARLVVAGAGPRAEALRRRAAGLPVMFRGFVSDRAAVADLLADADVVLAPGPIETFGLAALEALACGTPVVAADTSALREVLGHGAGIAVPPTPAALADGVLQMLAQPVAQRRAAARERAELFGWQAAVTQMLRLHGEIDRRPALSSVTTASHARSTLPPTRASHLLQASVAHVSVSPGSGRSRRSAEAGTPGADDTAPDPQGLVVVGLGDSVTVGVGDLVPAGCHPGWAAHVAHAVDASRFVNLARLGARARTVRDEQLTLATRARPDLALVCAGGNDVLRGDLSPVTVLNALHDVTRALHDIGCQVVLVRLPGWGHVPLLRGRPAQVLTARVARVNDAIDMVGMRTGCGVVDLTVGRLSGPQVWHVDRVHPGPAGHRALAAAALDVIAPSGMAARRPIPDVTVRPPDAIAQAGWLVRNGLPWVAKRSVDLVPALVLAQVLGERAAPPALVDPIEGGLPPDQRAVS
jgi:alpha-1,6-mannosyltransferase